jgi:hypothetical protein
MYECNAHICCLYFCDLYSWDITRFDIQLESTILIESRGY